MQTELLLPQPIGDCAGGVRQDMLGRGFSLVETPAFFTDELGLKRARRRTVLQPDCKRWWRFPQLARYGCWLERLLSEALPEEPLALANLEFRQEPANLEDEEVDRLHADGSYLRTLFTLYGLPTIYRDTGVELPVPEGRTLLMTAFARSRSLRVPCTLHRRPGPGPERAVIVCSFEPCENPQQTRRYREVASEQRD